MHTRAAGAHKSRRRVEAIWRGNTHTYTHWQAFLALPYALLSGPRISDFHLIIIPFLLSITSPLRYHHHHPLRSPPHPHPTFHFPFARLLLLLLRPSIIIVIIDFVLLFISLFFFLLFIFIKRVKEMAHT